MVNDEPGEVPTITELVRFRMRGGVNSRELERRTGGKVAHQRFDDLEQGKVFQFPKSAEVIEAQALALGVNSRQLILAYARQLGVELEEDQSLLASMLPANARRLSVRQSTVLVDLIDVMVPAAVVGALDLQRFSLEDLRDVTRFWQELSDRRASASPALAEVIAHVMATIDIALSKATTDR